MIHYFHDTIMEGNTMRTADFLNLGKLSKSSHDGRMLVKFYGCLARIRKYKRYFETI